MLSCSIQFIVFTIITAVAIKLALRDDAEENSGLIKILAVIPLIVMIYWFVQVLFFVWSE